MSELVQSIPLFTALLVALAGAFGAGYFAFGATLYVTAAGASGQAESGKRAMLTALLAVAIAVAGFGSAELVIGAAAQPALPLAPPPVGLIP